MSILSAIIGTVFPPAGIAMRVLDGAKSGAGKAFAWITASAAHILAIALAVALGCAWWGWHDAAKWEKVSVQRQNTITAMNAASAKNHADQIAMNAARSTTTANEAKDATNAVKDAAPIARDAASRYSAAHSLRGCSTTVSTADAAPKGSDPGIPTGLPADAVWVSGSFVQTAYDLETSVIQTHNLAVKKIEDGVAVAGQ